MKRKKIGIDVDGTLRDLMSGVNKVFKEFYPEYVIGDIAHNYDFPHINMPLSRKMDIIFNEFPEEIFLNTKPYPGVIAEFSIIKNWAKQNNFKLVCATQQESHITNFTYKWLENYKFEFDDIYISREKWNLGLDYIADDAPHVFADWVRHGNLDKNFFLINRDWNQDINPTNRITSIIDIIKKIK